MKSRLRIGALLATMIVIVAFATIQFWISGFIFRPTQLDEADPRFWGLLETESMKVSYKDGTAITGWWRQPGGDDAPVVLLVHGRSANVSSRASIMRHLAAEGMGVLMFDYRGYGASSGRASEDNIGQDTLTAYRWLRGRGIAARRIVVVGQSLGDAPASMLAAREPVAGLLLVSPFTSLPDALAKRLPPPDREQHWKSSFPGRNRTMRLVQMSHLWPPIDRA